MSLVVGLLQVMNPQDGEAGPVYAWAELGRAIYVNWWNDHFKRQRKNVLAGRDALERLSNTSWWDWEDGSRPHHLKWPDHPRRSSSLVLVGTQIMAKATVSGKDTSGTRGHGEEDWEGEEEKVHPSGTD
jgi:hypothetical protein